MKTHKRVLATSLVVVAGLLSASPAAFGSAAANPNASCAGSGSSAVGPGQGLDPFAVPGARADISHFLNESAALAGTSPGELVKSIAQDNGTVFACFPEGPPGS